MSPNTHTVANAKISLLIVSAKEIAFFLFTRGDYLSINNCLSLLQSASFEHCICSVWYLVDTQSTPWTLVEEGTS